MIAWIFILYIVIMVFSMRYCVRREIEHCKLTARTSSWSNDDEPIYIFGGILAGIFWPIGLPLVCLMARTEQSGRVRKFFVGK